MITFNDYYTAATELHYMTILQHNAVNITDKTTSDVKRIMTEYAHLDPGILNVILIYILRMKKSHIPNYTYMKKTIESWINVYEINSPKKAFQFLVNRMNYDRTKNDHLKKKKIN